MGQDFPELHGNINGPPNFDIREDKSGQDEA